MQGGRRYEVFIINAAVQMVERRNAIWVEGSNAIAYDYGEKGEQPIEDTTINDRIFELVSGMKEFIKTGRGDTLKDFMDDIHDLEGTGLELEKPIIEMIANISDAISLCDVRQFEKAVVQLRNELANYDQSPQTEKNQLFQAILANFEDDYGIFLSDQQVRVIDQIDWCIKKKLYQQALTLLESKVPDDFVNDKIFYFKEGHQLEDLVNRVASVPKYLKEKNSLEIEGVTEEKENDTEENCCQKVKEENINFAFIKYAIDKEKLEKEAILTLKSDIKGISCEELKEPKESIELLKQYFDIAHKRNNINHAVSSDDRPSMKCVVEALMSFSESYREVVKNEISINFSDIISYVESAEDLEKTTFAKLPERVL